MEENQVKASTKWFWFISLILIATGVGCSAPREKVSTQELSFEARMQVNSAQEFHVSLGIKNAGTSASAEDETFNGQMELRYADGEQAGELRARANIVRLAPLAPGETAWPMAWRAQLDPGTYTLTWGAENYGFYSTEFQIVERDGRLYLAS
jgi:hypothetical protein